MVDGGGGGLRSEWSESECVGGLATRGLTDATSTERVWSC